MPKSRVPKKAHRQILEEFTAKFQPITKVCTLAEKDALLKQLGTDYIVRMAQKKNDDGQISFTVTYLPKMNAQEKKELRRLKNTNPVTARKSLTWEMLEVRNKAFMKNLQKPQESAKVSEKTIQLAGAPEFKVYDLTENSDYAWMIHTTPNNAENLDLMREQIKSKTLWDKFPFLSCSLQDAHTNSYAGSQSIAHGAQTFPISLLVGVDPASILASYAKDARSPEGSDKTHHLNFVPSQLIQTVKSDLEQDATIPSYDIAQAHQPASIGHKSVETIIRQTNYKGYNEIIVLAGELAKEWGVKPPEVKAIIIEKKQLEGFKEVQHRVQSDHKKKFSNDITSLIKLATECKLPILLIDPKPIPSLKVSIDQANLYNRSFFAKEIKNYIQELEKSRDLPITTPKNKDWYQSKINLLMELKAPGGLYRVNELVTNIEDQLLLSMIVDEIDLDQLEELTQGGEDEIAERQNQPLSEENKKFLHLYKNQVESLKSKRTEKEADLQKLQRELNTHHPDLHFNVSKRPHGKK